MADWAAVPFTVVFTKTTVYCSSARRKRRMRAPLTPRSLLVLAVLAAVLLVSLTGSLDVTPPAPSRPAELLGEQQRPLQIGGTVTAAPQDDSSLLPPPPPRVVTTMTPARTRRETTLQCPAYAGPMFFPYYPGAKSVPRHPVQAVELPGPLNEQPLAQPDPQRVPLKPFALSDVRLEPNSRFGVSQRTNAAFLHKLDVDRLLYFFRRLAGLPQPRADITPYGGWESQGSGLRGEFAGHYLHAAAAAAAATSDAILHARCEQMVAVLDECQQALGQSGYLSAFSSSEFRSVEDFTSRSPWVPYYVMHKLLAGLISTHELLGSGTALRVALRLAAHLRMRVDRLLARGLSVWHDFINQEVGGMSEALADLARVTSNSSWLQLAALFERPCFVGPLALGDGAGAIERVHANTHLPQLLGAMARYEATGDDALRAAAEAFWDELSKHHLFATGGSTTGEVWLRAGLLGDAVVHQRKENYWAHDQAETCVAHNSMRVSRRLLQWSAWPAAPVAPLAEAGAPVPAPETAPEEATARVLRHAAYLERTLYNAVLGTQRGTLPGQMLYMFPLGSGVSKAGISEAPQGHHWSDEEHHFWCCMGSGIEAFARLADTIYWRRDGGGGSESGGEAGDSSRPPLLFVLQLLPSTLLWREAAVRVAIHGDYPGAIGGATPLRVHMSLERLLGGTGTGTGTSPGAASGGSTVGPPLELMLRLPQWASQLRLSTTGGLSGAGTATLKTATQRSLLPVRLAADANGSLSIEITPATTWERIKDKRPHFASLHAALYGPLVLGGFTYAERALPLGAVLTPVPPTARSQLVSLRVHVPSRAGGTAAADGCLISKWKSVWVVHKDRTRSFAPRPPADCLARATPIEDGLAEFPQAHGGGKGYSLDELQIADACARLDGCVLPEGVSAFSSGKLFLMHLGVNSPAVLAAPPPTVPGTRRGGTDAANAASWRLTDAPVGLAAPDSSASAARRGGRALYLESFELPGHVLACTSKPASGGTGALQLELQRVRRDDDAQLWLRSPATAGSDGSGGHGANGATPTTMQLESVGRPGHVLAVEARKEGGKGTAGAPPTGLIVPHRGAAISREWELVLSPSRDKAAAIDAEAPFAEYAPTSFWLARPPHAAEAEPPGSRPFLLIPLNEMQDEHYNVYWCKSTTAAEAAKPPKHCV